MVDDRDGLGVADIWRSPLATPGAPVSKPLLYVAAPFAATVINTAVIPACHIRRTRSRRPRLAGREDVLSSAPISLVLCPHRARCAAQRQCGCVMGAGHAPVDEAHRRRACVTDLEVRSRHHCDQRGREPRVSDHTDTLPPPVVSRS